MSNAFSDITDTPVLTAGWTVQNGAAGNQHLVAGAGSSGNLAGPAKNGLLAQNFDLENLAATSGGGVILVAGTMQGAKIFVNDELSVSKIAVYWGTVWQTPDHGWLVLLDGNGNLVASTGDMTSTFGNAGGSAGLLSVSVSGAPINVSPGVYHVGVVGHGGTPGKLCGLANPQAAVNANLGAVKGVGGYRFSVLATGITTALPTMPIDLTGMTADSTIQPFAALL